MIIAKRKSHVHFSYIKKQQEKNWILKVNKESESESESVILCMKAEINDDYEVWEDEE